MHLLGPGLFWGSVAILVYSYAGFGLLVALWGACRRRDVSRQPITPRVSLVVAAYNEAAVIERKIRNTFELDYPRGNVEMIVASDGSDDATESIVLRFVGEGVALLALPRRGKIHALDAAVERASGEILVFSDANSMLDPQALRALVRNFADRAVGGVCGNQVYVTGRNGDSSGQGEHLYWSYDKWLKWMESRGGSIVAADGALYAIRRALYRSPESAAVTDDFAISTAVVEQGYRLVYEPEAVAYEHPTGEAGREFSRRVRLMTRGMRGVLLRRRLLDPRRYGFYALVLFSHKVVRRTAPLCLLALLASSLALAPQSRFYAVAAALQLGFYALALCGWMTKSRRVGRMRILTVPFFYCLANLAALVALSKLVRGERIERWQPQRRGAEA